MMKEKMFIHWDQEGDFLEIRFGEPTASYYEDRGDDVFERRDEQTGSVKGYALFNVLARRQEQPLDIAVELPALTLSERE